jgi:hypothetical protein
MLGLVVMHRKYLDQLKWSNLDPTTPKTRAKACRVHKGMINTDGLTKDSGASVYVDGILMAIDGKENMLSLLAAAIEAIFLFCGEPQVEVRQCPLLS